MILYTATLLWAATTETTPVWLDALKTIAPGIIAALSAVITLMISRRFTKEDKEVEGKKVSHASEMEQLVKQREFIIKENEELWHALRKELEMCRIEREKLDGILENLRKRLTKVENELTQWELGLKTPVGFKLVRLDKNDEDKNQSI